MKNVCIHGHFYQPPRENPSLEYVELQESAYPYHDWNERVTAECYAPNAASRMMDEDGRIANITNNYSRISFDFGPTLLSWLEENAGEVYQSILEADRESSKTFSGHGSAMAQAYNHMIMPLANSRDKRSQVIWGLRDFEHRFRRTAEGMWLPETAVDVETLDLLAELGVKFTILAPRQASRVRRIGGRSWKDVSGERIDPTRAYLVRLPSKRKIAVFFYDGPISKAVAFERLLDNGQQFAERMMSGLAKVTDIIIILARWLCRTRWTISNPTASRKLPIMESFSSKIRLRTRWKSSRTAPGVAYTVLSVGAATVDAIQADILAGIKNGALHCEEHWIGFAIRLRVVMRRKQGRYSRIHGLPATITSV
jgi:hypothetical protein